MRPTRMSGTFGEDPRRIKEEFPPVIAHRGEAALEVDYLGDFDSRIVGLTGDPLKTEAIAKAFRVYSRRVPGGTPGDYTVDHTGAVYLVDKRGKFASVFNLQRPPQQAARELEAYF